MDVSEPGTDADMGLFEEPCNELLCEELLCEELPCEELFNPTSFSPALCVLAARMRLTRGAW